MPEPPASRCLQVDVAGDDVDLVSGRLWSGGVVAIQELALEAGRVRLIAGFPAECEAELRAALAPRWEPDVFDAEHDGWLDAWRPFARPVRVGSIVVHPPWEPPAATEPGDIVVAIDPGRAFGQGNHATTRLAIDALVADVRPGCSVLDVGCGSGVLAVIAARLGAERVVGVDTDAEAVRATEDNARRNGVEARVRASTGALPSLEERFDLVVANILASVLIELAPAIVECLAPGGSLVLTGLLDDQAEAVASAYRPPLDVVDVAHDGDWCRLRLVRARRGSA